MKIRNGSGYDVLNSQHTARKYVVIFLVHFIISVAGAPVNQQVVPVASADIHDLTSDSSGRRLNHAQSRNVDRGKAEVHAGDDERKSSGGSDVRESDGGRASRGQCRVLSLSEAAVLLARSSSSSSSRSTSAADDDVQRYLTELGRRLSTHTVVLCKAVAAGSPSSDAAGSSDAGSSQLRQLNSTTDHRYILAAETRRNRPNDRSSDDVEKRDAASSGSGNLTGKARQRPDVATHFRSANGVGNLSGSAAVHRLRHRRRRHRKQVRSSPFNRKYYGRRLRRTADECGGRRVDAVDVERTAAIMKAFYCWNDDVAALTNQLRLVARGNLLAVTSSASRLRCRLLRLYDDCRDRFIDKVFRTEHGLAISWPRQITNVMDRDDYSAIYY